MTKSLAQKMKNRISKKGRGWCFTQHHFSDLSNTESIRQNLSRLFTTGFIQRLSTGLYYYPRYHKKLGELPPKIDSIIKAIQESQKIKCQPSGAYAANLLGLSEQVPGKIVILTDGPSKKIKIKNNEVIFKKTVPKNMILAGSITGLIIQALKYIGKNHITKKQLFHLKKQLSENDINHIKRNAYLAPAWIAKIINKDLLGE